MHTYEIEGEELKVPQVAETVNPTPCPAAQLQKTANFFFFFFLVTSAHLGSRTRLTSFLARPRPWQQLSPWWAAQLTFDGLQLRHALRILFLSWNLLTHSLASLCPPVLAGPTWQW